MGHLGSGNMDKQVEAENTHCGDTCDACAATWLITARIMPTPGTEIAKASLADSSLIWFLRTGQGGNGRAVKVDFSSGAAAYGAGQRPSGCEGRAGHTHADSSAI